VEGLSGFAVPEAYQERHEIIQSLLWHRYTAREISDYLNKQGYRTPRGGTYYPELVGATISKLKRRRKSVKVTDPKVSELTFWLQH
jgi:K+/H+ antiporter YhaU regulatory subunit KhtT